MSARLRTWVRGQPVLAFYVLAFAITWLGWVPQEAHSHDLFPFDSPLFYILGAVGPILAAFIVLRLLRGEEAFTALFGPLLRWRVGIIWYIVIVFGPAHLSRRGKYIVQDEGAWSPSSESGSPCVMGRLTVGEAVRRR